MSETALASSLSRAGNNVVGYVEALTVSAALGWVWRPGFDERLTVELRFGDQTIAQACADNMREDLARSGIGDGKHAFTLSIPDAMRSRSDELRVVVVGEGEVAIVLGAPPASTPAVTADSLTSLQRGVEMLVGSQRLMHRNLQAALLQQAPSLAPALADIAAAQSGLQESIATFELFAIRLEQALAAREGQTRAAPTRWGLVVVATIACLALLASCAALFRIMLS